MFLSSGLSYRGRRCIYKESKVLEIASNMNENQQMGKPYPVRRLRNYGAGVLVILILSLGIAMVVYTTNMLPFNFLHLFVWILLPPGIFTCVYAVVAGRDFFYYLLWGAVMTLGGLMPVTSAFFVPMTLIGVFLIALAVIGIVAFWRKK